MTVSEPDIEVPLLQSKEADESSERGTLYRTAMLCVNSENNFNCSALIFYFTFRRFIGRW
jgi:hypothetical protein